jgi:hypothetical protein
MTFSFSTTAAVPLALSVAGGACIAAWVPEFRNVAAQQRVDSSAKSPEEAN